MPQGFTKKELLIGIPAAVVIVALAVWGIWYEYARVRDAQTYGDVLAWHGAFAWYFRVHAVYPFTSQDGMSLAGKCLVDEGLVSITDASCNTSARIYHASPSSSVIYYPRTPENTICTDPAGCSRYYVTIPQRTRAISGQPREVFRIEPRGLHVFGPDGLLINQKQIPGL